MSIHLSAGKNGQIRLISKQWKPLNVITLGQMETDNINRLKTITGGFYIVMYSK
jgi:hypothetical protein